MFWLSSKEGQGVNVLKPKQRATVITLLERNTPQREIARITGIDRKTIRSYHQRWLLDPTNSPGVATGSEAVATQIPPPWPPAPAPTTSSLCEVHREFIEAQLLLRRNAMAISKTWSMPTAIPGPTRGLGSNGTGKSVKPVTGITSGGRCLRCARRCLRSSGDHQRH